MPDFGKYLNEVAPSSSPEPLLKTLGEVPFKDLNATKYTNDPNWKMLGFDMNRNNDYFYDDAQSTSDWWANTVKRAVHPATNSFMESFRYDKTFKELFTSASMAEDQGLKDYLKRTEELNDLYPNYDNPNVSTGFNSYFSKGARNKWSSLLESSGFMIGTALGGITQSIVLGVLTAPVGGTGAVAPLVETANALDKYQRLSKLAAGFKALSSTNKLWQQTAATFKLNSTFLQGVEGVAQIKNATSYFGKAQGIAKVLGTAAIRVQAASAEAMLESIEGSDHFFKQQLTQKEQELGRSLTKEEKDDLQDASANLFSARYKANLGLLLTTNLLQDYNFFNTFQKVSKLGKLEGIAQKASDKLVFSKSLNKVVLRSALPFKEYVLARAGQGASFLGKNVLTEGFEEAAQYAIDKSTQDYFNKKYNKENTSFFDSVGKGISSAIHDEEGRENFWAGAIMGGLFSTIGVAGESIYSKAKGIDKQINSKAVDFADLNNQAYDNLVKLFKVENTLSADSENGHLNVQNNNLAQDVKNPETVEELRKQTLRNAVKTAKETGKYDLLIDRIKGLEELSDEDFKKQFEITDSLLTPKPSKEYITNVLNEIQSIKENLDLIDTKYVNPFANYENIDPIKNAAKREKAFIAYKGWEGAKLVLLDNLESVKDTSKKLNTIKDWFLEKNIVPEDFFAYVSDDNSVATTQRIKDTKSNIKDIEDILSETLSAKDRSEWSKKLKLAKSELSVFENIKEDPKSADNIYDLFNFLNTNSNSFNTLSSNPEINAKRDSFKNVLYEKAIQANDLVTKHSSFLNAVSTLEDPVAFGYLHKYYTELYEERYLNIKKDLDEETTTPEETSEEIAPVVSETVDPLENSVYEEPSLITETVSDEDYDNFKNNKVSDSLIEQIANKVINNEVLSNREEEILQESEKAKQLVLDKVEKLNTPVATTEDLETSEEQDSLPQDLLESIAKRKVNGNVLTYNEEKIIVNSPRLQALIEQREQERTNELNNLQLERQLGKRQYETVQRMRTLERRKEATNLVLNDEIKRLEEEKAALRPEIDELQNTLIYLNKLSENIDQTTQEEVNKIEDVLKNISNLKNSRSKSKTKRAANTAISLENHKEQLKNELILLNDITTRIKELQTEKERLEAIEFDSAKQIEFYENLKNNPTFILSKDSIDSRIDKLNKKVSVIQKLIDLINKAIKQSSSYLKELIKTTLKSSDTLQKFVTRTGFNLLSTEEIKKRIEDDTLNENYASLKSEFERLQNRILEGAEAIELLEGDNAVIDTELKRRNALELKLQNYFDQIRYLENLLLIESKKLVLSNTESAKPIKNIKKVVKEQVKEKVKKVKEINKKIVEVEKTAKIELKPVEQEIIKLETSESEVIETPTTESADLQSKIDNIKRRRQETNNKNEEFWEQFTSINAEEVADRDNLINKLTKDIKLPVNTRINNWVLEELNGKLWEGKNIRGKEEEYFGKENWDKIKEAKNQFDIEFKKIEDSNLAKIKLIEQKQSDLLSTIDGLELRKAWSFGLIEEPNVVGLDETNFISKKTEFKNGDLVETDNYEGYYYLSKPNKDDEWYEQIIGKTEQEVEDKINAKYDAEYVDAVKKGEMTKEQAMQALEEVGRKDSKAYTEIAALENNTNNQKVDIESIERRRQERRGDALEKIGVSRVGYDGKQRQDWKDAKNQDLKIATNHAIERLSKNPNVKILSLPSPYANAIKAELEIHGVNSNDKTPISEIIEKLKEINAKYDAELKASEGTKVSESEVKTELDDKKADIEKLEKEKQEALQPLIEEKERLEKEIAEIEKDTKGSLQESDRISSVKKEIANLRNENGEIPANKMGEFNKLSKLLRFLQLSPSLQIERAIQDFIDKNNLTDKQGRYIRSLSKIRDSFSEIVQELQDLTSVEFVKSDLMDIVDSNNTSIEKIINDSQDEINETKNKASNIAAKELGIEIEKEYSADELDNFVQKHGSNQTKFIWNLIKNIAQKLGVKTRFSLEGKTTVPNGYAGHYAQGKIDNRATLLQTPDVAARVIVHELVHGVTNYIIDAVKKNRTDVLSLLTQKQINAAKKLSALLKQLQSDSNTKDFYGAKNEDEILAELTHDGFVEALKNKKLNFVEKILDYILDILGVSTNAYEEALGILKDMLENPIDYIDKGFVQSNSLYSQSNTKLDQLKQQLAEVNKKIDEVTKRFDAQIAQKQSELKALEEQAALKESNVESDLKKPEVKEGISLSDEDYQILVNFDLYSRTKHYEGLVLKTASGPELVSGKVNTSLSKERQEESLIKDSLRKKVQNNSLSSLGIYITIQRDSDDFYHELDKLDKNGKPISYYSTVKDTENHPIIAVLTDAKGNPLYFNSEGTITKKGEGRMIAEQIFDVETKDKLQDRIDQRIAFEELKNLFDSPLSKEQRDKIKDEVKSEIELLKKLKSTIRQTNAKITLKTAFMSDGFEERNPLIVKTIKDVPELNDRSVRVTKVEALNKGNLKGVGYIGRHPIYMPYLNTQYGKVIDKIVNTVISETASKATPEITNKLMNYKKFLKAITYKTEISISGKDDKQFILLTKLDNEETIPWEHRNYKVNIDNQLLVENEPFIEYQLINEELHEIQHESYNDFIKSIAIVSLEKSSINDERRYNISISFLPSEVSEQLNSIKITKPVVDVEEDDTFNDVFADAFEKQKKLEQDPDNIIMRQIKEEETEMLKIYGTDPIKVKTIKLYFKEKAVSLIFDEKPFNKPFPFTLAKESKPSLREQNQIINNKKDELKAAGVSLLNETEHEIYSESFATDVIIKVQNTPKLTFTVDDPTEFYITADIIKKKDKDGIFQTITPEKRIYKSEMLINKLKNKNTRPIIKVAKTITAEETLERQIQNAGFLRKNISEDDVIDKLVENNIIKRICKN